MDNDKPVMYVKRLKTFFYSDLGIVRAVEDVSFCLSKQEILALVGESGCGKSVTALSLLRLIPSPPGKIVSGEAWFEGVNILSLSESQINTIRGNKISMIFQDPMTALNPVLRVGEQISEVILRHGKVEKDQVKNYVIELLSQVGIASPEFVYNSYPHQLSGGMRQRVLIAMAISCKPLILIADEPTTALDVTIQARILRILKSLQEDTGLSIIFITHDFRVVAEIADRVAVMYAGRIVEQASVNDIFNNPLHPYTRDLMNAIPGINPSAGKRLKVIPGSVPDPVSLPPGCTFSPRCVCAMNKCQLEDPPLLKLKDHNVKCWLYEKEFALSDL